MNFRKKPGYLKIETPKTFCINIFVCLRSEVYVYETNDHYNIILKGIQKS